MQESRLNGGLRSTLLILMAALAIAGCGEESLGALSVTKAEFIAQADRICRRADAMQPRAFRAYTKSHDKHLERLSPVAFEEEIMRRLTLPSVRGEIRELEALQPPQGEEGRVDAIIAGWKAAERKGERNPYAAASWWDPAKDLFTEINKIAVRYGFNDCRDLR